MWDLNVSVPVHRLSFYSTLKSYISINIKELLCLEMVPDIMGYPVQYTEQHKYSTGK